MNETEFTNLYDEYINAKHRMQKKSSLTFIAFIISIGMLVSMMYPMVNHHYMMINLIVTSLFFISMCTITGLIWYVNRKTFNLMQQLRTNVQKQYTIGEIIKVYGAICTQLKAEYIPKSEINLTDTADHIEYQLKQHQSIMEHNAKINQQIKGYQHMLYDLYPNNNLLDAIM